MSERRLSIEGQRRIRLSEMEVTAHLNRAVASVRHCQRDGCSVPIQENLALRWKNLAGYHVSATIATMPPNAATAPIVRSAILPIELLATQHRLMPAA